VFGRVAAEGEDDLVDVDSEEMERLGRRLALLLALLATNQSNVS
jgi:hypothetical protein